MSIASDSLQFVSIPVFTALIPQEGPKAVPLTLDFSVQTTYLVDMQNMQGRGFISAVQTIYIDNSRSSSPCTITFDQTQQSVTAAPNTQGYYTVLVANPVRFVATCAGGVLVTLYLLNVPCTGTVWAANAASSGQNTYSSGRLQVADATLDAAIVNGILSVNDYAMGDGGVSHRLWVGTRAAAGNVAASTGVLVTGAPGYFLTAASFSVSANAAKATAGDLVISLNDSSDGTIWQGSVWIPATAAAPPSPVSVQLGPGAGFTYGNRAANSTLSVVLTGGPLTTGRLYYSFCYGVTPALP